jgi:hypothetical protein
MELELRYCQINNIYRTAQGTIKIRKIFQPKKDTASSKGYRIGRNLMICTGHLVLVE